QRVGREVQRARAEEIHALRCERPPREICGDLAIDAAPYLAVRERGAHEIGSDAVGQRLLADLLQLGERDRYVLGLEPRGVHELRGKGEAQVLVGIAEDVAAPAVGLDRL